MLYHSGSKAVGQQYVRCVAWCAGLLLWAGTALLFLTFLPTRRLRRSLLRGTFGSPARSPLPGSHPQKQRYSA